MFHMQKDVPDTKKMTAKTIRMRAVGDSNDRFQRSKLPVCGVSHLRTVLI